MKAGRVRLVVLLDLGSGHDKHLVGRESPRPALPGEVGRVRT